ncbi:MAG TPA: 7-carboxy-7-deazaguanine synthase QueE [Anaerolineae bacterium]|nr:7-carboxy-7-deazaguanine synthase QueE [Anaerolineae bacterium]
MADLLYPVNDCYICVQGEGVQTGVAMVLLRLHGCGVGCPWCDTKETWDVLPELERESWDEVLGANGRYLRASAAAIAAYIKQKFLGPRWVLLTGGEPSQYELGPLVAALQGAGYQVALETSGTERGHLTAGCDWVCVSPKIDMPGGKEIVGETIRTADEIKHVVGREADIEALDRLLAAHPPPAGAQICLQPVSTSKKATQLCVETVQARGWRLSVQVHKYIGVN